jgi:hypothetical protein
MKIIVLNIILLISFYHSFYGQESQLNKEIKCQVIDVISQAPIIFATIRFKNSDNGLVADENGNFRLPYKYKKLQRVILVSSIGYKSLEISTSVLKDLELNIIKLMPKVEKLDEITLTINNKTSGEYISPKKIINRAINSIKSNFPTTSHSYIGYYRDYQLLNNKYFNLNESIIEVFDAGFQTNKLKYKDNQTLLYKYINNKNFAVDSMMTVAYDNKKHKFIKDASISPLGGNELNILNIHNPIRNYNKKSFSFIYIFKDNFLYNHEFRLKEKVFLDNIPIYKIAFFAKKNITGIKNSAKGIIYISSENYSIYKIEYNGYKNNSEKPFYSLKLEYLPKNGKMYLNYISFNNRFQIRDKNNFKIDDLSFDKVENAFYVTFSNEINKTSAMNLNNFKFIYNNRKLKINKINFISGNNIKISLINGTIPNINEFNEASMQNLKYKIKNITDIANRKLNRSTTITINQFRELFVQEVFPSKQLPSDVILVDKTMPLSKSEKNNFGEKEKYWINSPLKIIKN